MADFVVAITGGVASGKSAVGALFERRGITVIDADAAARAVVEQGQPALAEIRARFGPEVIRANGTLDRALLRRLVFSDASARSDLERITHPPIRDWLRERCVAAAGPYAMAAIPLLAETGSRDAYRWIRRVLVVDAPEAVQMARLLARDGIDKVLARQMLAAQASRARRLSLATDIVENDGEINELEPTVGRLDGLYRRLAAGRD